LLQNPNPSPLFYPSLTPLSLFTVGKGVGGLVFKSTAAVLGVPAYTMKGLEKQIEKRFDRDLKAKILEVRLRQGMAAYGRASKEEKEEIIARWRELGCTARLPAKEWAPKPGGAGG
jgi:hypothetical protein